MVKGISEALRDRGASPCDLEARRRAARADRRDECTLVDAACFAAAIGGRRFVDVAALLDDRPTCQPAAGASK